MANESISFKKGAIINHSELVNIIDIIRQINKHRDDINSKRLTPCFWGIHGLGKTEGIEDYCKANGIKFMFSSPAQFEEVGDLIGLPNIRKDTNGNEQTTYAAPAFVPNEECEGIWLIDDFNRASPRILSALMQLLQFYSTSAYTIPKGWTIICTANPDEGDFDYNVSTIDYAVETRLLHFTLKFNMNDFIAWGDKEETGEIVPYERKIVIDTTSKNAKKKLDPRISSFFLKNPSSMDLHKTNPRTAGLLSNIIKYIPDWKTNKKVVNLFISSLFSDESATNFISFLSNDLDKMISYEQIISCKNDNELNSIIEQLQEGIKEQEGQEVAIIHQIFTHVQKELISMNDALKINNRPAINYIKCLMAKNLIDADLKVNLMRELANTKTPTGQKTELSNIVFNPQSQYGAELINLIF